MWIKLFRLSTSVKYIKSKVLPLATKINFTWNLEILMWQCLIPACYFNMSEEIYFYEYVTINVKNNRMENKHSWIDARCRLLKNNSTIGWLIGWCVTLLLKNSVGKTKYSSQYRLKWILWFVKDNFKIFNTKNNNSIY